MGTPETVPDLLTAALTSPRRPSTPSLRAPGGLPCRQILPCLDIIGGDAQGGGPGSVLREFKVDVWLMVSLAWENHAVGRAIPRQS